MGSKPAHLNNTNKPNEKAKDKEDEEKKKAKAKGMKLDEYRKWRDREMWTNEYNALRKRMMLGEALAETETVQMRELEKKLEAEQQAQQMKFVLEREEQEANRKRVEARGVADFQKIVNQGLTPSYLKWKGIEATKQLADSKNTKVVVIGSGREGLPLILGNDSSQ